MLGAGLAVWGWRSGEQAPIDVVAQARATLGIPLESGMVETNGIRLHVVQAGPRDGPPVVLLHGFPEFWWTWHAQIEALAQAGFRVIAPDQRGFDLSDKPPRIEDYRPEERRADVLGLMDALGHERVSIAGHDFGAYVAWGLAIHHGERLRKLVVMNVAHPKVYASPPPGRPETINWFRTFFQLPWLPELVGRSGNWFLLERNLVQSSRPGTFAEPAMSYYKQAWAQPGAHPQHARLVPRGRSLPGRLLGPAARERADAHRVGRARRLQRPQLRRAEPRVLRRREAGAHTRTPATGCSTRSRPRRASC